MVVELEVELKDLYLGNHFKVRLGWLFQRCCSSVCLVLFQCLWCGSKVGRTSMRWQRWA